MSDRVTIHTDGACSRNPGPGGWGAILTFGDHEKELNGGESHTTNNRMELMAAISALETLKRPCSVDLYTDSEYMRGGITGWINSWKKNGWMAPFVSEDIAQHFLPQFRDPDGMSATSRIYLSSIAYNTNLVKPEDAPKSFADLLDPKWKGRIVKAHPGYSGTILTATYQIARDLGWAYFEQLAKQNVMQVQSSADPPKKLALGERAVMADGNEYNLFQLRESGQPVAIVYPLEGSPMIVGPNGVFADAPDPNAARLFQSYMFSVEAQQLMVDIGGLRSIHPLVKDKPGRKPLSEIKVMKDDPVAVEAQGEQIKALYTRYFHV